MATAFEQVQDLLEMDGKTVVERLDHWVRSRPDATCIYYGETDEQWSFSEFGRITDHIAGNLAALDLARTSRISVFTSKPVLAAMAAMGAWKIGAVYCPINFNYSGRLLSYQLNDTEPDAIVCDASLIATLADVLDELTRPVTLVLQGEADTTQLLARHGDKVKLRSWAELQQPCTRPDVEIAFDDIANVIYTSGTTGPAKGVVQTHRLVNQNMYAIRMAMSAQDVIYNDLPMYHIAGVNANFARAVWAGCEIAFWDRFSPKDFWARVAKRHITTAVLLDVMTPWLMKMPASDNDKANTLNKVAFQPLPDNHKEICERFGIDFSFTGFGQTESGISVAVLIEECDPDQGTPAQLYRGFSHQELKDKYQQLGITVLEDATQVPARLLGRVLPYFEADVLDERDQSCRPGVAGQLALRPRLPGMIMVEYLSKPDKTVSAWRNLWFHTGDAAVKDEAGFFKFVDRMGDRIRVRGENVSSFQVEDVLSQCPGAELVTAFGIRLKNEQEDRIAVFVKAAADSRLSQEDVRTYCEQSMPKFMRPEFIRVVDDLPRTPTNKIEKYKLRKQLVDELNLKV